MDAKKFVVDVAKESVGLNDFEKAKNAFSRAQKTSDNASGIKEQIGALPSYTKDIAVGVGDAAVGLGKAALTALSFTPKGRAEKLAEGVSSKLFPKITTPYKGGVPGRQFTPKGGAGSGGGTATMTRTQAQTKVEPAKPQIDDAQKAATKSEPQTQPKTSAARKTGSRVATFAAGAGLAETLKPSAKGDGPWTPSAIV